MTTGKKQQRSLLISLVALVTMLSVARADTIQVGLYQNEPKIYRDDQGQPAGLFVELIEAIAEDQGWALNFVDCLWADCLSQLAGGNLDLMPDVAYTPDRAGQFGFHQVPIAQSWSQLYAPPGSALFSLSDLDGRRLAVLRNSVQYHYLAAAAADSDLNLEFVQVSSLQDGFSQVESRQADAVVANHFYGSRHRNHHGLTETPITFNLVGLFFAAAPDADPALLNAIDAALEAWQADAQSPYYAALVRASAIPAEQRLPPWARLLLLGVIGLVILLLATSAAMRWTIKRRTAELHATHHRMTQLLEGSPVVVYALQMPDLEPYWVSGNVNRIFGFKPEQLVAADTWESHLHPDDHALVTGTRDRILSSQKRKQEYRLLDAQGRVRHIRDEQQLIHNDQGQPEVVGTWTDLTPYYEQEAQVRYLRQYDGLTGLPNRRLLMDRLEHALRLARQNGQTIWLLFIDLDRFKVVNDTRGTSAGDELLRLVARRLETLWPGETLARLGADEFVLMAETHHFDPALASQQVLQVLREPHQLQQDSTMVSASIGMACYPDHAEDADHLLTCAELAMVEAKKGGGNRCSEYHPALRQLTTAAFELENALRHALPRQELLLHYQPQFNLHSGDITGVEALIRWQHPERGLVSPAEFIPIAERTGLIQALDHWVLEKVCQQLRIWDQVGMIVPRVAINMAAASLEDGQFADWLVQTVHRYRLTPQRFELELTESMIMQAPERTITLLEGLRRAGFGIAMDDFGTGYSNLVYLRNLPLTQLKLDQSFVRDIGRSRPNESITRAIIAMAEALDLQLLAEGIETDAQRRFLTEAGCHLGQGYLLAYPQSAEALGDSLGSRDQASRRA
ncbi:EAL domain-containing protein [Natronospirillum operosum]|uniref:EAL domain-containing protein n=1 Tax=Natronospirillum operosum TaxID=2759953 RepID=UPI001436968D|nr:EAL domain-containing protein [Natronospirillum operosum]